VTFNIKPKGNSPLNHQGYGSKYTSQINSYALFILAKKDTLKEMNYRVCV